jgi:hypothetical protein
MTNDRIVNILAAVQNGTIEPGVPDRMCDAERSDPRFRPARRIALYVLGILLFVAASTEGANLSKQAAARAGRAVSPEMAGYRLDQTAEKIERGRQLAARLRETADASRLVAAYDELEKTAQRLARLRKATDVSESVRKEISLEASRAVCRIAFCNPLLDFSRLLFVKRHDAKGVFHMCDQFYGFNARPGGGLFVLDDPFGSAPKLTNLLAGAVVQKGRLKGRKLTAGSVLSPDLAFDGKTILFAYSECQGKDLEWSPTASYHIFKINADGTNLVQLTDGPCDDFDPCFLPGGRVAFISERRGGYLRCGRCCPTYTLFSMEADGGDILCLSYHETHEWQPSVDNNGMIVYTRWDYFDRDSDVAHHLWTCYPDGRDPRAWHGNYPRRREGRPWIEQNIRAIPGSQKYVATAAAHHGHAFGSLVLVDLRIPDDGAMSQLRRITPEVPFPESEGEPAACMVYGTPWPLSEDDYLCAYDPEGKNHGIYWIDRFGNRELIYRDATIGSVSPIPLRARPCPPILPDCTAQAASTRRSGKEERATIAVMNVYDADFHWPAGTKIKELRILQALAKSTAPPNVPRIGVAEQTNARAVLGTVPVEADGSAYFEAPPGKAIYFQVIDAQGMAVQSMRSVTYVHAGEQLVCNGCHEAKHQRSAAGSGIPLALSRAPATIRGDVDGSRPFNYVRLVQPVLDRNCVGCHSEKKALDLSGTIEGKFGWSRSYTNLAAKYGFFFTVFNGSIKEPLHGGSRTTAGAFGARASKLMNYLDARHYGVRLSPEDRHRITLWLDCNSEFYGSYERTAAQSRGEIVWPTLE